MLVAQTKNACADIRDKSLCWEQKRNNDCRVIQFAIRRLIVCRAKAVRGQYRPMQLIVFLNDHGAVLDKNHRCH